ncbi:MAG: hypothetical protein IJP72_03820 [Bacteroidales bacterium]|nr:hypothetical protein [Bacteroidales bacterium]
MKRIILFFTIVLQLLLSPIVAQIPVGTFRDHLSFYGCKSVAVTPEYIYAACNSGLLYIDKSDNGRGSFSKVDGLSGTTIARIHYDSTSRYLVVAYEDGNLDFIRDDRIYNLHDIKDKSITSSKKANGFLSYNGLLYITYPFGIVSVDMATLFIRDTWYTRLGDTHIKINSLQVFNNEFVINTDNGIYLTSVQNPAIADFNTWQKDDLMGNGIFTTSCTFKERIYVVKSGENGDTLYFRDENGWHLSNIQENDIRAIAANDSILAICSWAFIKSFDESEQPLCDLWWDSFYLWQNGRDIAIDDNTIWVADNNNGLLKIVCEWWSIELIPGKGPYATSSYAMDYSEGVLAMVPGMRNDVWGNGWISPNFSYFASEKWHNLYQKDNPSLYNVYDLTAVAINPKNNSEFFVGTYGGGLRKYDRNRVASVYDKTNSPIHAFDSLDGKIGGLAFDANNNLWVSCCFSSIPIAVLQSNGNWQPITLLSYTSNNTVISQIMVDSRNYKWIVIPRENKLLVYDDNKTISNPNDDRIASVNMNAMANIETSGINCVVEDKDGEIWIGCNLGIKVIYNPGTVFKNTLYAQNILIKQINYVQNLFEFEEVTCIAVDDANRKWVGTAKSGVFLISENGDQQLLHFTEENSPLLSDKIYNITINRATGEVFFATAGGLISYMGTATEGKEDYSEVTVFPNPVRETYHGVITVRGLMDNSFCKIADAAGNLVWQGYANGGELTWDGKDFYGKRVATGVYFVFSSDSTGKKRNVAKILFVK